MPKDRLSKMLSPLMIVALRDGWVAKKGLDEA
jgi:hypothetical protein